MDESCFDILSRKSAITTSLFLEASAGTGKTFAIEHLCTRLLLEGDSPPTVSQLLVVTFTRVATRELKERIYQTIKGVLEDLEKKHSSLDYVKAILEESSEKARRAMRLLQKALDSWSQAQVLTIHAFCYRALQKWSDGGWKLTLLEQEAQETFLFELIQEQLKNRAYLGEPHYLVAQIGLLLAPCYGSSPLKELLKALMNAETSEKPINYIDNLYTISSLISAQEIADFDDKFLSLFASFKAEALGNTHHCTKQWALIKSMLEKKTVSWADLESVTQTAPFFWDGLVKKNLKKKAGDIWCFLEENQISFRLQWAFKDILSKKKIAARFVSETLELARERVRAASKCLQQDLLPVFYEHLDNDSFCLAASDPFQVAIIDEFQDTDPLQWKILSKLFSHKIMHLVGDGKQSIYGFRKADLSSFQDTKAGFSQTYALDTNFRACQPLVQAQNALFIGSAGAGWQGLAVKSGAKKEGGPVLLGSEGIHFFWTKEEHASRSFPSKETEAQLLAFIIARIKQEAIARQWPWSRFAILVQDRYQAKRVQARLEKERIPSTIRTEKALEDCEGLVALIDLLCWITFPKESDGWPRILYGPWLASLPNPPKEDRFSLFFATQRLSWLKTISYQGIRFWSECWLYKENELLNDSWANALRKTARGALLLHELERIIEVAEQEEEKSGRGLLTLIPFLESLANKTNPHSHKISPPPCAEKGVEIMTIFASKGLEFGVVFPLGLASRKKTDESDAIQIARDEEKLRLFYVAATRAQYATYLPVVLAEKQQKIALGSASPMEIFLAHALCEEKTTPEDRYSAIASFDESTISALKIRYSSTNAAISFIDLHT